MLFECDKSTFLFFSFFLSITRTLRQPLSPYISFLPFCGWSCYHLSPTKSSFVRLHLFTTRFISPAIFLIIFSFQSVSRWVQLFSTPNQSLHVSILSDANAAAIIVYLIDKCKNKINFSPYQLIRFKKKKVSCNFSLLRIHMGYVSLIFWLVSLIYLNGESCHRWNR